MSSRLAKAGVAAALLLLPTAPAWGADESRPATRASFSDVPCLMVVDRSVDPVAELDYSVPFDDLDRTEDEVSDGRTLQFFAFRRHFIGDPPNWITYDDVARAADAPASTEESQDVVDEEVLEASPEWPDDMWFRITPDDARRPISHEEAAKGIVWDTTGLPQGTYFIEAYTWDPARNAWSPRWGGVRVVDDAADPAGAPPSIFFPEDRGVVSQVGETHEIGLCAAGMAGSTVSIAYAVIEGVAEPQWTPVLEDASVAADGFDLAFEPPESGQLRLRARIEDPMGRTYTAYSMPIDVLPAEHGDTGTTGESGTAGETGDGGGCRLGHHRQHTPWLLLLALLMMPRARQPRGRRRSMPRADR